MVEMSDKTNFKNKKIFRYPINNELYEEDDYLKDCPDGEFVPTVLPPVKRIIAIGDIHGDLELAIKSFKLANLINDDFEWIADPPDTVVVQVGDQIDSCRPIPGVYECHKNKYADDVAEDVKILHFFTQMHNKAKKVDGAVYSLLGNHELMNSQGKFNYVSYENYHNFDYTDPSGRKYSGSDGRRQAFKPGGPLAKMMACTRPSVLIIGSTMFVHAGVLPVLASKLEYLGVDSDTKLKYLNAVVRKWLLHKISDTEQKRDKKIFIDDQKISPFWTRIYGSIPENTSIDSSECFSSVKKALQVYKVGQLVVGHTPQLYTNDDGINGTCFENDGHNKLYRVDGGFSRAFNVFNKHGAIQVLEILNDQEFNIITDRTIYSYTEPPETSLSQKYMDKISKIYAQNRIKKKKNHY